MLAKRVIPCLDVKDGRVVKGVNFVSLRDAGDPVELARAYDREGADEVVFLDITATSDNRATTIEMAAHAAEELAIPYTVGGGFRDLAGMRTMVAAGADKVSLNSAAVRDPSLISQAAAAFGSQAVVVAIDAKRVGLPGQPDADKWEVFTAGGRNATGIDAVAWAEEAAPVRSCSPAWIATAPRLASTWHSPAPWRVRCRFPSSRAAAWARSSILPRA